MEARVDLGWGYGTEQRLRDENQDSFGVFKLPGDRLLALVCDGMGGHAGGGQASAMAVRIIHDKAQELVGVAAQQLLEAAITDANRQIYDMSRRSHRLMGMGTTVVVALIERDVVHIAHVGDSRAYLVRDDQAQQLTRDHTMVNLFVEAELLSPEDAASHPEAHVLARSLGVERTVDVEHHEPFEARADDTIVLCSDGIHGLLTEWEFGRVNWETPQQGIRKVLQMVNDREGDDSATLVSLGFADGVESELPLTPPPDAGGLSDTISGATSQAQAQAQDQSPSLTPIGHLPPVPDPEPRSMDSLGDLPPPPDMHDEAEELAPQDIELEELDPDPVPIREALRFEEAAARPPPRDLGGEASGLVQFSEAESQSTHEQTASALDAQPAAPGMLRLGLIAGGAAAVVLVIGVLGIAGYTILSSDAQVAPQDDSPSSEAEARGDPVKPTGSEPSVGVTSDVEIEPEQMILAPSVIEDWRFAPEMPRPTKKLPHHPETWSQPTPFTAMSKRVHQSLRERRCAEAHRLMAEEAIPESTAYAKLYSEVWLCFTTHHSHTFRPQPLQDDKRTSLRDDEVQRTPQPQVVVRDLTSFQSYLINMQGDTMPETPWGEPAIDGIEYRLEAFETSVDDTDIFRAVVLDVLGPQVIADDLGRDLLVEAQAALALSVLPDAYRNDQTILWWARRVYVVRRAMDGPAGQLIKNQSLDLAKQIEVTLATAVPPPPEEPAEDGQPVPLDPVPPLVRQAIEAATAEGELPEPELALPGAEEEPGDTQRRPPVWDPVRDGGWDKELDEAAP